MSNDGDGMQFDQALAASTQSGIPEVVYTASKPLNFVEQELGIHRMVSNKPIDDDDIAWKRADLVVDRSLAEEILEAVSNTDAYTYFRYKLNSARGE